MPSSTTKIVDLKARPCVWLFILTAVKVKQVKHCNLDPLYPPVLNEIQNLLFMSRRSSTHAQLTKPTKLEQKLDEIDLNLPHKSKSE